MTRIADPKPAYCASCYGANADWRYVDFEAAYDGAVIPGSPANQPVDDLILCENCLAEAFALLDPDGLHEEIRALKARIEVLEEDIETKDRMIGRLDTTQRELVEHPIALHKGRQIFKGDKEVIAELNRNRKARKKEKVG